MKRIACLLILIASTGYASADPKYLECNLKNVSDAKEWVIKATIDDASDKAEVQSYEPIAPCNQKNSCPIDIYKKEALPTVIRLIYTSSSRFELIEINRETLSVYHKFKFSLSSIINVEREDQGKCTITELKEKRLL